MKIAGPPRPRAVGEVRETQTTNYQEDINVCRKSKAGKDENIMGSARKIKERRRKKEKRRVRLFKMVEAANIRVRDAPLWSTHILNM